MILDRRKLKWWAGGLVGWVAFLLVTVWMGEWRSLRGSPPVSIPLRMEEVHIEQRPWKLEEAAPPAPERAPFAAVYGPNYVRQDFTSPAGNLSRVDLWMAGPIGQVVSLTLRSQALGLDYIAQCRIVQESGTYYRLVFPTIQNSKGQTFSLIVAAPTATIEGAISLRVAPGDRVGGMVRLNLYPVAGNLDLVLYHKGLPGRWWADVMVERVVPTVFRSRLQQYKPGWAKGNVLGLLILTGITLSGLALVVGSWHKRGTWLAVLGLGSAVWCLGSALLGIVGGRNLQVEMASASGTSSAPGCCTESVDLAVRPHTAFDLLMNVDRARRDLTRERDRDYAQVRMISRGTGSRPSLALAAGRALAWGVHVPVGASFRVALVPFEESGWFELWVATNETRSRVFRQEVQATEDWHWVDTALDDHAGQWINLEMRCPEGGGFWVMPHLMTRGEWLLPYPFSASVDRAWREQKGNFDDLIELLGYRLTSTSVRPGGTVRVDLYWHALQSVKVDYTVFVHLLDAHGTWVSGQDSWPVLSTFPTTLWTPDHVVLDSRSLTLPDHLLAGTYTVEVGLYQLATLTRLPVYDASGDRLTHDAVRIEQTITVNDQP